MEHVCGAGGRSEGWDGSGWGEGGAREAAGGQKAASSFPKPFTVFRLGNKTMWFEDVSKTIRFRLAWTRKNVEIRVIFCSRCF